MLVPIRKSAAKGADCTYGITVKAVHVNELVPFSETYQWLSGSYVCFGRASYAFIRWSLVRGRLRIIYHSQPLHLQLCSSGLAHSLASQPSGGSLNRSRGLVEGFSPSFRTSLALVRKWVACSDVGSHVAKYARPLAAVRLLASCAYPVHSCTREPWENNAGSGRIAASSRK